MKKWAIVVLLFLVGCLAGLITMSIHAANAGPPELITVDGTVDTVAVTAEDWQSQRSKIYDAYEVREPGHMYLYPFSAVLCKRGPYMECGDGTGAASGTNAYAVKQCEKKRRCNSDTHTNWRYPHITIEGTATVTINGAQKSVPFVRYVAVNPIDGEDIMAQARPHVVAVGDTVQLKYYEGHEDDITATEPEDPNKQQRNLFIMGAVVFGLVWFFGTIITVTIRDELFE